MLLQQRGQPVTIGAAGHVLVAGEELAHQGALRLTEGPEKVAHRHPRRRTAWRTRPVGAPAAGQSGHALARARLRRRVGRDGAIVGEPDALPI